MRRPARIFFALMLAMALVATLAWMRTPSTGPQAPPSLIGGDAVRPATEPSAPPLTTAAPGSRDEARVQRDALRRQILEALGRAPAAPPAAPATAPALAPEPRVYPPGNLQDRIGGRDALLASLNHEFMPLAHECIDQAQQRSPGLHGILALGIETVADRRLGAVIESAEATAANQIADCELLECVRESALSLRLPPPPNNSRETFEVTLRIVDEVDAGA